MGPDDESLIAADFHVAPDALRKYLADGYYIFAPLLSAHGLALLRAKCDERRAAALALGNDGSWLMEVVTRGKDDWLAQLLVDARVRPLLAAFCGPSVCFASAQFFVKPANADVVVGWHQDATQDAWMHWIEQVHALDDCPDSDSDDDDDDGKRGPPTHQPLTLWLPLDDVTADRGGLRVLPRLHTRGKLPEGPIGDGAHRGGDGVGIDPSLLAKHTPRAVSYELAAGQPATHHPYTPHSSGPNLTATSRRVLLVRLLPLKRARWYEPRFGASIPLRLWTGDARRDALESAALGIGARAQKSEEGTGPSFMGRRDPTHPPAVILWEDLDEVEGIVPRSIAHGLVCQAAPGAGEGCFAIHAIQAGTCLMVEAPLRAPSFADLAKAVRADLKRFDTLCRPAASGHPPAGDQGGGVAASEGPAAEDAAEGIVAQNGFYDTSDGACLGVRVSKLNHSCAPNCAVLDCDDGFIRVMSTRPIASAEEATICYSTAALFQPRRERRGTLTRLWGFECRCARCEGTLPAAEDATWQLLEEAAAAADAAKPRRPDGDGVNGQVCELQRHAMDALHRLAPFTPDAERFEADVRYFGGQVAARGAVEWRAVAAASGVLEGARISPPPQPPHSGQRSHQHACLAWWRALPWVQARLSPAVVVATFVLLLTGVGCLGSVVACWRRPGAELDLLTELYEALLLPVFDGLAPRPPAATRLEPVAGASQCSYELLDAFAHYADAQGVRYTLAAGTLLGAMRNRPPGLLQWEHDVDVYVPARDASHLIRRLAQDCGVVGGENMPAKARPLQTLRGLLGWRRSRCGVLEYRGLVDASGQACCGFGFKLFHRKSGASELDVLVLAAAQAPFMHGETWAWPPWGALLAGPYHWLQARWHRISAQPLHDGVFYVIPEDVRRKVLMADDRRWCRGERGHIDGSGPPEWAWCGGPPLSYFHAEYFAPGELFPATKRAFHDLRLSVPRDAWALLRRAYGRDSSHIARLNEHGDAVADLRMPEHAALRKPAKVRVRRAWWHL